MDLKLDRKAMKKIYLAGLIATAYPESLVWREKAEDLLRLKLVVLDMSHKL